MQVCLQYTTTMCVCVCLCVFVCVGVCGCARVLVCLCARMRRGGEVFHAGFKDISSRLRVHAARG